MPREKLIGDIRFLKRRHVRVVYSRLRGRLTALAGCAQFTENLNLGNGLGAQVDRRCLRLGGALLALLAPRNGVIVAADYPGECLLTAAQMIAPARPGWVAQLMRGSKLAGPPTPFGARAIVYALVNNSGDSLVNAVLAAKRAGLDVRAALAVISLTCEGALATKARLAAINVPFATLLVGGKPWDESDAVLDKAA